MKPALQALLRDRLVVIARGIPADFLSQAALALRDAGIRHIESTFDHSLQDYVADNVRKLRALKDALGDTARVGAGTVLTVEEVRAAADAGCEYIISPGTDADVIAETKRLGMLSIPGAMTPTEILTAWKLGADIVKLFPADDLGMHYLQNLRGPLPHIPLMATGGVNPATIPEFLRLGVAAVGTGVTIFRRDLVDARDARGIAALGRMHVEAIRLAEGGRT